MPDIGVFPFGAVLLPTERLPLHIFEPRYRELIGECIDSGGELGMLFEDEDGLREVGTLATVDEVVERFEDGRLNVVVAGTRPFRVLDWTAGRSFRTAEVERLHDDEDPPDEPDAGRALGLFRRLAELAGSDVEPPRPDSERLSYELAGRVEFTADVKQELLESRSERERLERVAELLTSAIDALTLEREVSERAARNGKLFAPRE
jgi:ATP-dependent Lon protease